LLDRFGKFDCKKFASSITFALEPLPVNTMRREYGALLAFSAVLNVKLLMFISNSSCSDFDESYCLLTIRETGSRILLQPFKSRAEAMQHMMSLQLVMK
jgi:hypothetical protein